MAASRAVSAATRRLHAEMPEQTARMRERRRRVVPIRGLPVEKGEAGRGAVVRSELVRVVASDHSVRAGRGERTGRTMPVDPLGADAVPSPIG